MKRAVVVAFACGSAPPPLVPPSLVPTPLPGPSTSAPQPDAARVQPVAATSTPTPCPVSLPITITVENRTTLATDLCAHVQAAIVELGAVSARSGGAIHIALTAVEVGAQLSCKLAFDVSLHGKPRGVQTASAKVTTRGAVEAMLADCARAVIDTRFESWLR